MPRAPFDPATDYYGLLGLTKTATRAEIMAAYRKLAKLHHPDMHAGSARAEARMARINRAKSVLLDPAIRADYDAARQVRFGPPPPPPVVAHAPVHHVDRRRDRVEAVMSAEPPTTDLPASRFPMALVFVLVPLALVLSVYVVGAVQVAVTPLPPRNTDFALVPITRPNIEAVALSAYTLVQNQAPSRRLGDYVYSQTAAVMDSSPESSFLKAAGRRIQRAGANGDTAAWSEAVLDLCRLSGTAHC